MAARRRRPAVARRFLRPDPEVVRAAALRALRRAGRPFESQAALRRAMLPLLREEERRFALGGARMRRLLLDSPALRLEVHYAKRPTDRPIDRCPVCRSDLVPIRNRTLTGGVVTLGFRCGRCQYWTHLERRVPVRYRFLRAGVRRARPG
ncbi:MAG: hypothetical protein L3K04_07555 [Thermoplasmata archaeon]|nr:hypothetical protein [Thermoplasmata archaeon]